MSSETFSNAQGAEEVAAWRARITKPAGLLGNASRAVQRRINTIIPETVHAAITAAMQAMTQAILTGADFVTASPLRNASLEAREAKVLAAIDGWKTAAGAEGGVVGAGGFLLAAADFPLLMSFKLKLLFEIAALYGHDGSALSERLYILHIFELAFSDAPHRIKVLEAMADWDARPHPADLSNFDWRAFQQQYRDHIDLAKLAQMLPIVGAPVGAVVNWRLTAHLGKTAMMAYRMRWRDEGQGGALTPLPEGEGEGEGIGLPMTAATTRASRLIPASPDAVWAALMDPEALVDWLPPGDMTGQMHAFDGRVGGGFEMSLYYPDGETEAGGKSDAREDRTHVRFKTLEPGHKIVWAVLFATDDPTLKAEMTLTITLQAAEGGTRVALVSTNLPVGLKPADNAEGSRQSLEKLAKRFGG